MTGGASPTLPPLREVIAQYGLRARKNLGQNFLLDLNLTKKIARAAGRLEGIDVVEVGPGPGGLTRALLSSGATRLVAIERDARCVRALGDLERAYPGRLTVVSGDALDVELARLVNAPAKIVANLPYNIATPLLFRWLRQIGLFSDLTLMFQLEVAKRITAKPATKSYGRLAVMSQWLCATQILFEIPARAFTPPPKVTSALVQLVPRPEPLGEAEWEDMELVVAAAFGKRRKMLRSALKSLDTDPSELLSRAGIPATARAEELEVTAFCGLARAYRALRGPEAVTDPRSAP